MEEREVVCNIKKALKIAAEEEITLNFLVPRLSSGVLAEVWTKNKAQLTTYFRAEWKKARHSERQPRRGTHGAVKNKP